MAGSPAAGCQSGSADAQWASMTENAEIAQFPTGRRQARPVVFDRREMTAILDLYGRMVAAGAWRDYALDGRAEEAVFAVFRRASEAPLYRIVKRPKLVRRQGLYAVIGPDGRVLRRSDRLESALALFEKRLIKLVE